MVFFIFHLLTPFLVPPPSIHSIHSSLSSRPFFSFLLLILILPFISLAPSFLPLGLSPSPTSPHLPFLLSFLLLRFFLVSNPVHRPRMMEATSDSEDSPSASSPLPAAQVVIRSPTQKKGYRVRTPVSLDTVQRVFNLASPYLVSTKSKASFTPNQAGFFTLHPTETNFVVHGLQHTPGQPSQAIASYSSSSSSSSSSPAKKPQSSPSPAATSPRKPKDTKNGWDDLEEDFAEEQTKASMPTKKGSHQVSLWFPPPDCFHAHTRLLL